VQCTKVDLDAIRACRDQLWAEAVHKYRSRAAWWLESETLNSLAETVQAECYEPAARDEIIAEWIQSPQRRPSNQWHSELPWNGSTAGRVSIQDILVHGLEIAISQIKPADHKEVARCLRHLNWKVKQDWGAKNRGKRFYISPEPPGYMRPL
jgi:putative DNA primase/helicase